MSTGRGLEELLKKSRMTKKLKRNLRVGKMELINFVNMNQEEARMVLRWRNNDEVRKWMYRETPITAEEHKDFLASLKTDPRNFYYLVKEGERYLGVINLTRLDYANRHAYLGIYRNPEEEIIHTGTKLGRILLTLAFDIAGLHTLKLEVIEDNERAIHLYKKMGFVEEGRLREFVFRDGKWKDVIIMGMTEEEYRRKRHESGVENRR